MTFWHSNGYTVVRTVLGADPAGCASLEAVADRKSTSFHCAEGRGTLEGIGKQWPNR
jgi:hypothetical protein